MEKILYYSLFPAAFMSQSWRLAITQTCSSVPAVIDAPETFHENDLTEASPVLVIIWNHDQEAIC